MPKVLLYGIFFPLTCLSSEKLQAQSLLSNPDWLERHNPPPLEEVSPPDNLSVYEHQLFQELMEVKPLMVPSTEAVQVQPDISAPRLSREESLTGRFPGPFFIPEQQSKETSGAPLSFPAQDFFISTEPVKHVEQEPPSIEKIRSYLDTNPRRAQEDFEKIEHTLLLEDRALTRIQLLYHLGQFESAEKMSRIFIQELPQNPVVPEVYYYHQLSLREQGKDPDRNAVLLKRSLAVLNSRQGTDLLNLLSDASMAEGKKIEALGYRLEGLVNPQIASKLELEKVTELLKQVENVEDLRRLGIVFSEVQTVKELFRKRELDLLVSEHHFREASALLEQMLEGAQNRMESERIEKLRSLRRRFSISLNVNPKRIGVILPLSSTHPRISRLVQQSIAGLRLALLPTPVPSDNQTLVKEQAVKSSGPHEIELILRDSRLSEETTRSAFRELVEKEHVIAVIGPLARRTSEAAAEEAQRWKVPMISLSLTSSIPKNKEFVFRNNQNWKLEVQSLVRYAHDYFQAKRFAILFSRTREGRQKAHLFQQVVGEFGGKVVALKGFIPLQKSFIHEFDTFTGKLRKMSPKEVQVIEELEEKEDPISNFDAVFVAIGVEGMKDLQVIFPYAAVYQMEKTLFLGDSGWNHPALPFMPRYQAFRRLVFTDGYVRQTTNRPRKHFFEMHERQMHRHRNYSKPSSYAAYAYDTLTLLKYLLSSEIHHSHRDLQQALLKVRDFPGVTGKLSFNNQGEIQRSMQLFTLRKGRITLID